MEREEFLSSMISDQLDTGFVNLNWDQSMDQNPQFESALSSIVSSPSNPTPPSSNNVVIRELIGRLGSICNSSGEMSLQSNRGFIGSGNYSNSSIYTSGYNTPINSPPKLGLSIPDHHHQNWGNLPIAGNPVPSLMTAHLGSFVTDPGFAERAARFSSFVSGRSYVGLSMPFVPLDAAGKMSRASSSKSLRSGGCGKGGSQHDDGEVVGGKEEPSVSNLGPAIGGMTINGRKRKGTSSKGKSKELVEVSVFDDDSNAKKNRSNESKLNQIEGVEEGECSQEQGKENSSKPSEPPKQDYIHVRARRGQATDSHSLAERVRREKISERMKFLQDLVPGCNKVTGKALMLDEIINYVQLLQRQVEFLSMKLASVHPQSDLKMKNLVQKDMHFSFPQTTFPAEASGLSFTFSQDTAIRQPVNLQSSALDSFGDDSSLIRVLWEDDLNSVVKMGFGLDGSFPSHHLPGGQLPAAHMKVENDELF